LLFKSPISHYFNKTAVLRGDRQKMPKTCGDLLGDRLRSLLASYWLKTCWEMRSLGLHCYLGISQSVSDTLRALLKRSLILFRHFPTSPQYPLGTAQMVSKSFSAHFPMCLGIDLGIFFTFPLKQHVSVYYD
jgi:hypothetical protein